MKRTIERLGAIPSLIIGATLFVLGLLSLNQIVDSMWPFDVTRLDLVRDVALERANAASILDAANMEAVLVFLATVLVTITGLVLPLAFYLNKRFAISGSRAHESPGFWIILRQSMWVGLWVAFCLWLQMNRTLGIAVAGLCAAVLILLEILLQVRTRAATVRG